MVYFAYSEEKNNSIMKYSVLSRYITAACTGRQRFYETHGCGHKIYENELFLFGT